MTRNEKKATGEFEGTRFGEFEKQFYPLVRCTGCNRKNCSGNRKF